VLLGVPPDRVPAGAGDKDTAPHRDDDRTPIAEVLRALSDALS